MEKELVGVGVVVEYNPFHNGHKYHYNLAKKHGDVVIAVMSGDFVQRGEPAFIDKWTRAELALKNGIDIVIELPSFYSTQSAEIFARGSVGILDKILVKKVVFGSEIGDIDKLIVRADLEEKDEFKEKLKKELKTGNSYPTAYSNTIKSLNILDKIDSNDILGIEYIKALRYWKSDIKPIAIKREKSGYYSQDINEGISSATGIRKKIELGEEIKEVVPEITYKLLEKSLEGKEVIKLEQFYNLLRYKILVDKETLNEIQDIEIGFENRLYEAALKYENYNDFFEAIQTKRYTIGRTQRILVHILLKITKEKTDIVKNRVPYIRVLGFNQNGQKYLKQLKDKDIKVLTILKNIQRDLNEVDLKILEENENASKIYNMIANSKDRKLPIILK